MAKSQPATAPKKPAQEPVAAPGPAPEATPSAPPAAEEQPANDLAPTEATSPAPVDEPTPEPAAAPAAAPAPAADEPLPDLEDFITGHERAAQAVDLVVTAISHPAAKPRHYPGVYSGFPITTGALSATYSDGSTH